MSIEQIAKQHMASKQSAYNRDTTPQLIMQALQMIQSAKDQDTIDKKNSLASLTQMLPMVQSEKGFNLIDKEIDTLLSDNSDDPMFNTQLSLVKDVVGRSRDNYKSFKEGVDESLNFFKNENLPNEYRDWINTGDDPVLDTYIKGFGNDYINEEGGVERIKFLTDQERKINSMLDKVSIGFDGKNRRYSLGGKEDSAYRSLMEYKNSLDVAVRTLAGDGIITEEEAKHIIDGDMQWYMINRAEGKAEAEYAIKNGNSSINRLESALRKINEKEIRDQDDLDELVSLNLIDSNSSIDDVNKLEDSDWNDMREDIDTMISLTRGKVGQGLKKYKDWTGRDFYKAMDTSSLVVYDYDWQEEYPELYDKMVEFEGTKVKGSRGDRHNSPLAPIFTDELAKEFGATKGDPFYNYWDADGKFQQKFDINDIPPTSFKDKDLTEQGYMTHHTAKFKNVDQGENAAKWLIDKVMKNADGDLKSFIQKWTGEPEDSDVVKNYYNHISQEEVDEEKAIEEKVIEEKAVPQGVEIPSLSNESETLKEEDPGTYKKIEEAIQTSGGDPTGEDLDAVFPYDVNNPDVDPLTEKEVKVVDDIKKVYDAKTSQPESGSGNFIVESAKPESIQSEGIGDFTDKDKEGAYTNPSFKSLLNTPLDNHPDGYKTNENGDIEKIKFTVGDLFGNSDYVANFHDVLYNIDGTPKVARTAEGLAAQQAVKNILSQYTQIFKDSRGTKIANFLKADMIMSDISGIDAGNFMETIGRPSRRNLSRFDDGWRFTRNHAYDEGTGDYTDSYFIFGLSPVTNKTGQDALNIPKNMRKGLGFYHNDVGKNQIELTDMDRVWSEYLKYGNPFFADTRWDGGDRGKNKTEMIYAIGNDPSHALEFDYDFNTITNDESRLGVLPGARFKKLDGYDNSRKQNPYSISHIAGNANYIKGYNNYKIKDEIWVSLYNDFVKEWNFLGPKAKVTDKSVAPIIKKLKRREQRLISRYNKKLRDYGNAFNNTVYNFDNHISDNKLFEWRGGPASGTAAWAGVYDKTPGIQIPYDPKDYLGHIRTLTGFIPGVSKPNNPTGFDTDYTKLGFPYNLEGQLWGEDSYKKNPNNIYDEDRYIDKSIWNWFAETNKALNHYVGIYNKNEKRGIGRE